MKKSKVISVQANGTWEGKYGIMYKYEVSFENGDSGEYSSKSENQTKFIEGQETEYEFIDGKFPKVKPVNTFQQTSSFKKDDKTQEYIIKQNALTNACNVIGEADVSRIIEVAEVFADWVLNNKKPNQSNTNLPF